MHCVFEVPTFGVTLGDSRAEVKWKGLALDRVTDNRIRDDG